MLIIHNMQNYWRGLSMKNNFRFIVCIFILIFSSCEVFPDEGNPYSVSAEFEMEESSENYEICGVNISFYNHSDISVKEFVVVFFLFDEDGEPAQECSTQLCFDIEKEIESGEKFQFCLSLDSYMTVIPQSKLQVDYLYVSKIIYEDGSVWEDPYGFAAFR